MLKRLLNRVDISVSIKLLDPLLIKSGQATVSGVDMAFVRTYRQGKAEPFIPGSSLKGMFRAHAERICRTLKDQSVCLPYVHPSKEEKAKDPESGQAGCGFRMEKTPKGKVIKVPSQDAYRLSCPVCKIFGSTSFVGRMAFSDACIKEGTTWALETRDGIAIDRYTGGVAGGAKYDLEVLSRGEFTTSFAVRNFERWQLGLLSLVLADLGDGLIRLGSGKSRGLGGIKVDIDRFEISYYGSNSPARLSGLWHSATKSERESYGLIPDYEEGPSIPEGRPSGIRIVHDIKNNWQDLLEDAVGDLNEYLKKSEWPKPLNDYVMRAN
jgi:CRISPR-associated RAMP protein (TIGR02581 family)